MSRLFWEVVEWKGPINFKGIRYDECLVYVRGVTHRAYSLSPVLIEEVFVSFRKLCGHKVD